MGTTQVNQRPPAQDGAALSAENYSFLQQYIQRESGIDLGAEKHYLLESRLMPVAAKEGLSTLDDLCKELKLSPTELLRRRVVEAMTTHETLFFRDIAVFESLRTALLPELMAVRQATRTLRIWSAASSSGQEAYSLAMMLLELGCADWNIQILGTDLSLQILDRARAGRFLQIEVNRGLPAKLLAKYFVRAGLEWEVSPELKRMVSFTQFDLRQGMRALGNFDLVLCRNVLIYFDVPTRKQILNEIRGTLFPGGYLLLGSSETTFNLDDSFARKTIAGAIVYQNPVGRTQG